MSGDPELEQNFLSALGELERSCFEEFEALDRHLLSLWGSAQQRWPTLAISSAKFATFLAERVVYEESRAVFPDYTDDLYLALGCILADENALKVFESDVLSKTDSVLRRLGLSAADSDDVRQELRERLLITTETRPAVLASYAGSGGLVQWVRAVAGRQALMNIRRRKPTVSLENSLYESFCDPLLAQQKSHYRAEFKKALHQAVDTLEAWERTILQALIVEGRTVTDVAVTYDVHRVTASRWVSKIRNTIFTKTRSILRNELKLGDDELQSVIRLIESQIDMSLARLLENDDRPQTQ